MDTVTYTWGQKLGNGFEVSYLAPLMVEKWIGDMLITIDQKGENEFELKWNVKKQEFTETFPTLEKALEKGAEIK